MALLTLIADLLLLSGLLAWLVWFVLWFPLMARKQRYISDEARATLARTPDLNAAFGAAFLYDDAMRADPVIRRLRVWRLALFLWPFAVIAVAAVVFNFVLP